jgi:hypothetical protein
VSIGREPRSDKTPFRRYPKLLRCSGGKGTALIFLTQVHRPPLRLGAQIRTAHLSGPSHRSWLSERYVASKFYSAHLFDVSYATFCSSFPTCTRAAVCGPRFTVFRISNRLQSFGKNGANQLPGRRHGFSERATHSGLHTHNHRVYLPTGISERCPNVWNHQRTTHHDHWRGPVDFFVSLSLSPWPSCLLFPFACVLFQVPIAATNHAIMLSPPIQTLDEIAFLDPA